MFGYDEINVLQLKVSCDCVKIRNRLSKAVEPRHHKSITLAIKLDCIRQRWATVSQCITRLACENLFCTVSIEYVGRCSRGRNRVTARSFGDMVEKIYSIEAMPSARKEREFLREVRKNMDTPAESVEGPKAAIQKSKGEDRTEG